MRYSKLFGKTSRQDPKDEESVNAKLLIKAGFIEKLGAGIYNFLPLGWRVHKKIEQIVREEIDAIGGQELNLAALHPKARWEKTGRWNEFDALFKVVSRVKDEYALGATHEEILTPIVGNFATSYKDLPIYLYQIQVKFRDEFRAKSGLLRCREFIMKDLYSFHATEADRSAYYEKVKKAYTKIFKRMGFDAIYTEASGGAFGDKSHEFQVITNAGEDSVIYCEKGDYAQNSEIANFQAGDRCSACGAQLREDKAIEVGNIFPLGTRFSEAFGGYFTDSDGSKKLMIMGSYGIGLGRLMGTIVEVSHDEKGIIWPESVSPYQVHFIRLKGAPTLPAGRHSSFSEVVKLADEVYERLQDSGVEVLYDDRDISAGTKFADSDLIGISIRLVISEKTGDKIEWKNRGEKETILLSPDEVVRRLI